MLTAHGCPLTTGTCVYLYTGYRVSFLTRSYCGLPSPALHFSRGRPDYLSLEETNKEKMEDRLPPSRSGMPPPIPRALARARGDAAVGHITLAPIPETDSSPPSLASALPSSPTSSNHSGIDLIPDASPRSWDQVFSDRAVVDVGGDSFVCYAAGLEENTDVVCVLLHGGGHCALSWGMVAAELKSTCGVLAFDARGHGESVAEDEDDLSAERQVEDAAAVVRSFFEKRGSSLPNIVLVGHSMGGAVAVRLGASGTLGDAVKGLVVIDVVEGTAMAALPHMRAWLAKRKQRFGSVDEGVRYVVRAGHVRNVSSARLSVPRELQLRGKSWVWRTDLARSSNFWKGWFAGLSQMFLSVPGAKMLVLAGIDRLDKDLMIAQMQGKFQVCSRLLAGAKALCGQLFFGSVLTPLSFLFFFFCFSLQNMVIPGAGHVVHEDRPTQTADVLREYLVRNCFVGSESDRSKSKPTDPPRSRLPPC